MPEIEIPTYVLKEISFDEIYPVWDKRLWPGRKSKIEPMSSLVWNSRLFLSWGNSEIKKDSSIKKNDFVVITAGLPLETLV